MDVNESLQKVENSVTNLSEMVDLILGDQLQEIDNYLTVVRQCFMAEQEILDSDLDKIVLQIPVYLYNLIVFAQQLEMRAGVAKEHATYAMNEAILGAAGTAQQKQATAENATVQDKLTELAYKTATKTVGRKIDGAMAILDSAKKVQQRRLKEKALTKMAGDAVGGAF